MHYVHPEHPFPVVKLLMVFCIDAFKEDILTIDMEFLASYLAIVTQGGAVDLFYSGVLYMIITKVLITVVIAATQPQIKEKRFPQPLLPFFPFSKSKPFSLSPVAVLDQFLIGQSTASSKNCGLMPKCVNFSAFFETF